MPPDQEKTIEDETFERIWEEVADFTMTSKMRGYALYLAVRYLVRNSIHGAFVECGVWRGGSIMLMLKTLVSLGTGGRDVFLFDTFSGMSEASPEDIDLHGRAAAKLLEEEKENPDSLMVAAASLDEVRENVMSCGYPDYRIHFVRGDARKTPPQVQTGPIALLRLDTDFYDSTKAELETLYPRVSRDGVVIIDDYGHWRGARKAVDEYFAPETIDANFSAPLLLPIDYTGRIFVKRDEPRDILIRPYDYHPPNLQAPNLLPLFPSLEARPPKREFWRYLRHAAPHIWRVDSRDRIKKNIGVLSVEEAILLHALARQFKGRRALEIGCHFGWSSAHLLTAGLKLDILDPALGDERQKCDVAASLDAVMENFPGRGAYRLWAGFSPSMLPAIIRTPFSGRKWAFAFIDGNHSGDAPRDDARAVMEHMADDAMVVFHDLLSPDVMRGLDVFRKAGWKTRCYNTMQVMGVAWRGDVRPVKHEPDPNMRYPHQRHLAGRDLDYAAVHDDESGARTRKYPQT